MFRQVCSWFWLTAVQRFGKDDFFYFLCVVAQAQLELLHEKAGQFGVTVRRSFPSFDSLPGLRMALAMKIKVTRAMILLCTRTTVDIPRF